MNHCCHLRYWSWHDEAGMGGNGLLAWLCVFTPLTQHDTEYRYISTADWITKSRVIQDILLKTYLPTYLLTYSMQHSPSWEANRLSASQEIPYILRIPKVHYRSHKCPPPVPTLCQFDPVHIPTSYFLNIRLNIILPSTPGSPKWSLSLRFPHKNPVYASLLPHMCYRPCPSHSSRFYHPNNIGRQSWTHTDIYSHTRSEFYCGKGTFILWSSGMLHRVVW